MELSEEILSVYFKTHQSLVAHQDIDPNNCLLSLPLHYSSYTRIELVVTRLGADEYVLTDQGQTLTELRDAGHTVGSRLMDRVNSIIREWQVDLAGVTLIKRCRRSELGQAIHDFGEAAKTVGDAYLMGRDRSRDNYAEEELKDLVRTTFAQERYAYKERAQIPGLIEKRHEVDFYIAPNGSNGLALEVLSKPKKNMAEAWGFRARDMRDADRQLVFGFVYDETVPDLTRTILHSTANFALPSSQFMALAEQLQAYQISRHA